MTEELLIKIRKESEEQIKGLEKYNKYARLRNLLAEEEEVKASLGLPYTRNMHLPEKTEEQIIMEIYKKYERFIDEKDTNDIYVYYSTYMPSNYTYDEIEDGAPHQIEVSYSHPDATHRYYYNLESLDVESVNIEDQSTFEQSHTVLYVDNFYKLQEDFIVTAVRESEEKALSKILKNKTKKKCKD